MQMPLTPTPNKGEGVEAKTEKDPRKKVRSRTQEKKNDVEYMGKITRIFRCPPKK